MEDVELLLRICPQLLPKHRPFSLGLRLLPAGHQGTIPFFSWLPFPITRVPALLSLASRKGLDPRMRRWMGGLTLQLLRGACSFLGASLFPVNPAAESPLLFLLPDCPGPWEGAEEGGKLPGSSWRTAAGFGRHASSAGERPAGWAVITVGSLCCPLSLPGTADTCPWEPLWYLVPTGTPIVQGPGPQQGARGLLETSQSCCRRCTSLG